MSPSSKARSFDLHQAFLAKQKQLAASLHADSVVADHPTTKGDAAELNWLKMLSDFLPQRYGVSKAHVVDSRGSQSDQIDIVIHDRFFSPLLFEVGTAKYIPAESVYAVFEVKPRLDRENLLYAADKIASVRDLIRTSAPIPSAMGTLQRKNLDAFVILGGILAPHSSWSPPLGEPFRACLAEATGNRTIDFGCALEHGAFELHRCELPEKDAHQHVNVGDPETALISFAMTLLHRLQRMASAPAIDYPDYGAAIQKSGGSPGEPD